MPKNKDLKTQLISLPKIKKSEIVVFKPNNGNIEFQVVLDGKHDTIWATELQIAEIFGRNRTVINRHIKNAFNDKELNRESTSAKIAHVRFEGSRKIEREVLHYNLDVIISVGYKVKSPLATEFRKWATLMLKEHLIQGYSINEKRLSQKEQEVQLLKGGIQILSRAIEEKSGDNEWLTLFSKGLSLLDDYDHEQLDTKGLTTKEALYPSLEDYQILID
jgi:hypothetical protein